MALGRTYGAISLCMSANSLLIVPATFNPSTGFANYSTLGLTHTAGTTLNVPAGQGFAGQGSISDAVVCQGTITAASTAFIDLNNGLMVSGTGNVSLGTGSVTVNDPTSGITGGLLSTANHYVGYIGAGTFTQSGGTNNISQGLYLGYTNGDIGTYILCGNGQLSAASEYVGHDSGATALFRQNGGGNMAGYVSIGSGGCYLLSGGTLSTSAGLSNQGVFDGGGGTAVVNAVSSIVDLSRGTLQNVGSMSMSLDANSLLIIPAGFDPYKLFGNFSSAGLTHYIGTTLNVPAGQGFSGQGSINDPVICQGTIASASFIHLNNGLILSGTGNVNLGAGSLTVNDTASAITNGLLSTSYHYVGYSGTGVFTQSGGVNTISAGLYLAFGSSDSGTYNLNGSGQLSAGATEFVGYSGAGTFAQSGGTNSITSYYWPGNAGGLYLGANAGGSGTYNLSGSGQVSASSEFVGCSGSGTFKQSGGSNSGNSLVLFLGNSAGGSGTYNLSGNGHLSAPGGESVGVSGTGTFSQSGGTNSVGSLYLGANAGGVGTYSLSGSSQLSAVYEFVGSSGTGAFTQTGAINNNEGDLTLGNNPGSLGAYSFTGSGRLSAYNEYVGLSGTGTLTQTSGINSLSGGLVLGRYAGSIGTYNLNGGVLVLSTLSKGSGAAAFNFNGGTLGVSSNYFSTSLPMTLGTGGGATFNTGGHTVSFWARCPAPAV